jgi:hypothetical protein
MNTGTFFGEGLFTNPVKHGQAFNKSSNNHLKTPAEIDAEFALHTTGEELMENSLVGIDAQESIFKNGGSTVNPASFYHGFMEENY